jgi:hypothetical protein
MALTSADRFKKSDELSAKEKRNKIQKKFHELDMEWGCFVQRID